MKVRSSVKPICPDCKRTRRKKKLRVTCRKKPRHNQRQG